MEPTDKARHNDVPDTHSHTSVSTRNNACDQIRFHPFLGNLSEEERFVGKMLRIHDFARGSELYCFNVGFIRLAPFHPDNEMKQKRAPCVSLTRAMNAVETARPAANPNICPIHRDNDHFGSTHLSR